MRFSRTKTQMKTVNFAGGKAYAQTPRTELIAIVLTTFLKDQFYRTNENTMKQIKKLVDNEKDKLFIAKLALFARHTYGMRSVSHLLATLIAESVKGEVWTKTFFDKIIKRPDDMVEILGCYLHRNNFPVPNAMKKGFAMALERMNEYQLAKYRCENREIKLVDVVNIVHPKNTLALKLLMSGNLNVSGKTWEAELSAAGQEADEENLSDLKSEAWEKLLNENKLGYFALLRNLRNIANDSTETALDLACEQLVKEEAIKKSLVLPFRFMHAAAAVNTGVTNSKKARQIIKALGRAIDISLDNVPSFPGDTVVVLDDSGSMTSGETGKTPADIGSLFAAAIAKKNNAGIIMFNEVARYVNYNSDDTLSTITEKLREQFQSGGTDFNSIFEMMDEKYDRIIILSDTQGWMGVYAPPKSFSDYKKRVGCNPLIYSFDLSGYGSLQFPEKNVFCLSGFSEKTLDTMKMLEEDKDALIKQIEEIEVK